jgi:hypothetical protein
MMASSIFWLNNNHGIDPTIVMTTIEQISIAFESLLVGAFVGISLMLICERQKTGTYGAIIYFLD